MNKQTDYEVLPDPMKQRSVAIASQRRREQLTETSLKVRTESMEVNAEFSVTEDIPNE